MFAGISKQRTLRWSAFDKDKCYLPGHVLTEDSGLEEASQRKQKQEEL